MRDRVAKVSIFLLAVFGLAALFGLVPYIQDTTLDIGGYVPADGKTTVSEDGNAAEDENGDTNWMYPSISMTKEDTSYWTDRYTKEGFRFFFGNDDRAGIATKGWLKEVQSEAKKYMKETDRKGGDEAEFNDFVHNALKAREVAALEEYEDGKSYPNGRDMYIFYDESGDTKVLPVSVDDTEFDFTDAEDPYDVLSKPEETMTGTQAQSLIDSLFAKYASEETANETIDEKSTDETVTGEVTDETNKVLKPTQRSLTSAKVGNVNEARNNADNKVKKVINRSAGRQ